MQVEHYRDDIAADKQHYALGELQCSCFADKLHYMEEQIGQYHDVDYIVQTDSFEHAPYGIKHVFYGIHLICSPRLKSRNFCI